MVVVVVTAIGILEYPGPLQPQRKPVSFAAHTLFFNTLEIGPFPRWTYVQSHKVDAPVARLWLSSEKRPGFQGLR